MADSSHFQQQPDEELEKRQIGKLDNRSCGHNIKVNEREIEEAAETQRSTSMNTSMC